MSGVCGPAEDAVGSAWGTPGSMPLFPPGQPRDPGTPGTRRGERRLPVAQKENGPTGRACQAHRVRAFPTHCVQGTVQVHGGGQQADSTPGDSTGCGGTPGSAPLSALYVGPRCPPSCTKQASRSHPQGSRSFGEEVHVTLSPPARSDLRKRQPPQLLDDSGNPIHEAEEINAERRTARTKSMRRQRVCEEGGGMRWMREAGSGAKSGEEGAPARKGASLAGDTEPSHGREAGRRSPVMRGQDAKVCCKVIN